MMATRFGDQSRSDHELSRAGLDGLADALAIRSQLPNFSFAFLCVI